MKNLKLSILFLISFLIIACGEHTQEKETTRIMIDDEITSSSVSINKEIADKLIQLPLKCIQNEYPYKSGLIIAKAEDLQLPIDHHPAFFGCFDWHSAVHGHWSIVYLLKNYPSLQTEQKARIMLAENLTKENLDKELAYFSLNKASKSFERTYGWTWLLKLAEELYTWEDPQAKEWYLNLKPLCNHLSAQYIDYLPKLVYPIRVGEHSNTAFGLSFAYDYSKSCKDSALQKAIEDFVRNHYMTDTNCPLSWEPSGYDFLSPCLEELNLVKKVLPELEFDQWIQQFLPQLSQEDFVIEPGRILDRSDGKLVHLDGLNFSRAWCLYPLIDKMPHLKTIADNHVNYSFNKIADGDYSGEHWLASFALYALKIKSQHVQ